MRRLARWTRLREKAWQARQDIIQARLSRREMFKLGLLTSAGTLAALSGLSDRASSDDTECEPGQSPPTHPFVEPLPIMPILPAIPQGSLDPAPTACPNNAINPATGLPFEGRGQFNGVLRPGTDCFQFFDRFPPQQFFRTRMRETRVRISPDLPLQTLWGFNLGGTDPAVVPGPTIVARYGVPNLVRRVNELPPEGQNGGFGIPSVTTHLHNMHSGSESDGGPCRYFERGQYFDYHRTMARAGFDSTHPPFGDVRETMNTLWYHDHRIENTAQNTYKGLAGIHLNFDELDTGQEFTGFRLPSFPEFDIPLVLMDKLIHPSTGLVCFDLFGFDGLLGDKFLVNGKIQPFFEVKKRRYRFRVLNTGPSRFYQLFLTDPRNPSTRIPFWVIANDGNLLPRPVQVESFTLGVAERFDILVDFARIPGNPRSLRLENRLVQDNGRGPKDELRAAGQGDQLMEFRIGDAVADGSVDPATGPHFYDLPDTTEPTRVTRTFRFERQNGQWAVNGRFANCNEIRFRVKRNTVERWRLVNESGGWQHPIHVHLEEFQILSVNGVAPAANSPERSRKDVMRLGFNQTIEVIYRFRDFRGDFPIHCHNVIHEDHAMMLLFAVDDEGDLKQTP